MTMLFYYRCGIPVILMGETGCGKTRLIKFMCELRAGRERVQNMLLVKVQRTFFFSFCLGRISIEHYLFLPIVLMFFMFNK